LAVIIDEIQVDVLPGQTSAGEPAAPQPAGGGQEAKMIQWLELAQERAERLSCD
jgi:DNA polymerase II small subunit/DNA polymerase delta subunit B